VLIVTDEDGDDPSDPFGFSNVVLDRLESYVLCTPMLWRVHALAPGLMRLLPTHDPAMLISSLTSYLRGVKASADITHRTSASKSSIRSHGRDVPALEGRTNLLLRASGVELLGDVPV